MEDTLHIENFGPIKKTSIQLKEVMILIGPQSSGKSIIAKLISIFRDFSFIAKEKSFVEMLANYNIDSYLKSASVIKYKSEFFSFSFTNNQYSSDYHVKDSAFFDTPVALNKEENSAAIAEIKNIRKIIAEAQASTDRDSFSELYKKLKESELIYKKKYYNISPSNISKLMKESVYIPAERTLISILMGVSMSIIQNKIPLPSNLIDFGAQLEFARNRVKKLNIPFLKLKYEFLNGEDVIIQKSDNKDVQIKFSQSSSGLQSILPLLLVLESKSLENKGGTNFIIEEPESNLFPETQYDLIKFISAKCIIRDNESIIKNNLIITTHSPYVLSAINNLMFAYKNSKEKSLNESTLFSKYWINPEQVNALLVSKGTTKTLINKKTSLIEENELDKASEKISADFNKMLYNS